MWGIYSLADKELQFSETPEQGVFEGRALTLKKALDYYGQRVGVKSGAFKRTIDHHPKGFPIAVLHNPEKLVGMARLSESANGATIDVVGKIARSTARGQEAWDLLKAGVYDCLSLTFRTIKENVEQGVYWTTEGAIKEISLTPQTFAFDKEAQISAAFAEGGLINGRLEERESYYYYRLEDPAEFQEQALADDQTFEWRMLSEKPRVAAMVGKLKSGTLSVQALRFAKESGWTPAQVKAWIGDKNFASVLSGIGLDPASGGQANALSLLAEQMRALNQAIKGEL